MARALAVLLMLLATPGAAQLVEEVMLVAIGAECCDGGCDEEQGCPGPCAHCVCCPHPNLLSAPAPPEPSSRLFADLSFGRSVERPHTTVIRPPPFRPPVA